jgi:hypothetical protein
MLPFSEQQSATDPAGAPLRDRTSDPFYVKDNRPQSGSEHKHALTETSAKEWRRAPRNTEPPHNRSRLVTRHINGSSASPDTGPVQSILLAPSQGAA